MHQTFVPYSPVIQLLRQLTASVLPQVIKYNDTKTKNRFLNMNDKEEEYLPLPPSLQRAA